MHIARTITILHYVSLISDVHLYVDGMIWADEVLDLLMFWRLRGCLIIRVLSPIRFALFPR